jgi:hypothetical protein
LPRFDSPLSQDGATNPNYEKITLHFSQCRASRSLRTEDRRCCSGEFACACENGKEHHDRKSAGDDGEDQGDNNDQYDHGGDTAEFVELHYDDNHDFEPQPVVLLVLNSERLPANHLREAFLFVFLLLLLILILILPKRSGARSGS